MLQQIFCICYIQGLQKNTRIWVKSKDFKPFLCNLYILKYISKYLCWDLQKKMKLPISKPARSCMIEAIVHHIN